MWLLLALHLVTPAERRAYPWVEQGVQVRSLRESFAPPPGFRRVEVQRGSFGAWLRDLPLRADDAPVRRFDRAVLHRAHDSGVAAVAELDTGKRDLQQCADSILRLWAEWLHGKGRDVAIELTSGDVARFSEWAKGQRAEVRGNRVRWVHRAQPDDSRASFRAFLDLAFTYAGTLSIARLPRPARAAVRPGDFFVQGGSPGHAVLILEVAQDARGHTVALIGQGYTPAQDFHVLAGPWFSLDADAVETPFWQPFRWSDVRRLPE